MEGKIDFRICEDGFILVIDKWLNLGDGMDPRAKSWRRHESGETASNPVHVSFDQTTTMKDFETLAVRGLADRTRENEELFLGKSGRRSLEFVTFGATIHHRHGIEADYWVEQVDTRPTNPSLLRFWSSR